MAEKRASTVTKIYKITLQEKLCNKYNYFYDKDYGELLTVFYDSETRMLTEDQQKHYETKYGIKFLQGAEE